MAHFLNMKEVSGRKHSISKGLLNPYILMAPWSIILPCKMMLTKPASRLTLPIFSISRGKFKTQCSSSCCLICDCYLFGKIATVWGALRLHINIAAGCSQERTDFVSVDFCIISHRTAGGSQQSILKYMTALKCWYFSEIVLKGRSVIA